MGARILVEISHLMRGSDVLVTRVCDVCGNEKLIRFHHVLSSRRDCGRDFCKSCAKVELSLLSARSGNSLAAKFPEIAATWHPHKNGLFTPQDVTPSSNKLRWWKCTGGHTWQSTVDNRTKGNGCGICAESKGERYIREWFVSNGVTYNAQVTVEELTGVGGRPLVFDFVVFHEERVVMYVEYDGEQHFEPRDFLGKGKSFAYRQFRIQREHDRRKTEWCALRNVPLLRIKYNQFNVIPKILSENMEAL